MPRFHTIYPGIPSLSSLGQFDDDPHLKSVKVEADGRIFEVGGDGFLFWHVGRMFPSRQLIVYIPGLADTKNEEITEATLNNPSALFRVVRRVANMGE